MAVQYSSTHRTNAMTDIATQAGTKSVPQPGFELTPSAAARWVPVRWLSLEAQLGWALQLRSLIVAGPMPTSTRPSRLVALPTGCRTNNNPAGSFWAPQGRYTT